MNKLYSVHDHWTDINKKNDVDIESIDGVITGIKVNGEDYGGGGGSSDFSTAQVIFRSSSGTYRVASCKLEENNLIIGTISEVRSNASVQVKIPLIDDKAYIDTEGFLGVDFTEMPVFSGGISMSGNKIVITGNGSVTLKGTV